MTSAEESVVNQVLAMVEHAGPRLSGLLIEFKFADGTSQTVLGIGNAIQEQSAAVVDVREQASDGEAVAGGDPQGQTLADPSPQEVDEAPMSKGKRKK